MPDALPVYHVIFHSPGPRWDTRVSFQEQPGVMEHVQYCSQFLQKGLLVMGGPFLDNSGGMMVLRTATIEEAQKIALDDPAVRGGLLRVVVRPWMRAMKGETE